MRDRRRSELADNERRRNDLSIALKPLPALETRLSEAQAGLSALERELQKALVNRGVVEGELKRLNALERELRARERERHELQQSKGIFDELAVAFGRNGIQALIIETAIPDLQNDANELLGRLTDGRMTLKLQLREGRKERLTGTPSEELDIRIGDEVGTRAYEMFSGGEAFRINFALRIALSPASRTEVGGAVADPVHRRGVRDSGHGRTGAAQGSHPIDPVGLPEDHRDHPSGGYQGVVPHAHRGHEDGRGFDVPSRVDRRR